MVLECQLWLHLAMPQRLLVGGKGRKGDPGQRSHRRKTYPAGGRGRRRQLPSTEPRAAQRLSGREGKVQRPRSRAGAGAPASTLTQPGRRHLPPPPQPKAAEQPGPRLRPGNLHDVATETSSGRAGPAQRRSGAGPRLPAGQARGAGNRARATAPSKVRGEGRGDQEGGRLRERGGFRSTSFSLPLPRAGSGPPHPPQGAVRGAAGRGEEEPAGPLS